MSLQTPSQLSTPSRHNQRAATAALGGKEYHTHRPLPLRFCHDGFDYRQIARDENAAIYAQSLGEKVVAYEAIRVRRHDGFLIHGKKIEAAEIYPRSAAWGVDAWTYQDRESAFRRMKRLSRSHANGKGSA